MPKIYSAGANKDQARSCSRRRQDGKQVPKLWRKITPRGKKRVDRMSMLATKSLLRTGQP